MKPFFLLLFCTAVVSANAQKTQWGFKAGGGISTRSGYSGLGVDNKPLGTLQGAVFGIVPVAESFVMQASLGYCGKGNQIRNLQFTDELGNDIGIGTAVTRINYIMLSAPFQFKSELKNNITVYSGGGPYVGFAASGVAKAKNVSNGSAPAKQNINFKNNYMRRFDAGINLMLSMQFQQRWIASIMYEQGLVNLYTNDLFKSHNAYSGLTVGYIFK